MKVHPNSSLEKIEIITTDFYEVWLNEKPADNKANYALVKLLKKYFKKSVRIKSGFNSRIKFVEVFE